MKEESIGLMAWDSSNSNNWVNASLKTYLNGTYYNGLNSTAKNQIVAKNFSIGSVTWGNNDLATQINNENSNKWYGNIALPTVSEYIRTNSDKGNCGTASTINSNYRKCVNTGWLDNENWWTLSPYSEYSKASFTVDELGQLSYYGRDYGANSYNNNIHPTLHLSSNIKIITGTGTAKDPYIIE